MRNCVTLFFLMLILANPLFAQEGLPANPEPGKCYIRCVPENPWRDKILTMDTVPAYTNLTLSDPVFKTVIDSIEVRAATKRYEFVPAVYKKIIDTIRVADPYNKATVIPAVFIDIVDSVITQERYARFETRSLFEDCKSPDPRDCQVLCYVEHKPEYMPVRLKKMVSNAKFVSKPVGEKFITVEKEIVISPPQVKEIVVPAQKRAITKKVLVQDQLVKEVNVAPKSVDIKTRVLEKKGSGEKPVAQWEEIECQLVEPNLLPIYYALNSANLTTEAKKIIDEKIYKLMVQKSRIKIQINSHTDSRENDDYNMKLSQRRAQSVVDYLISKGIASNRLVSRGFGETQLKNKCSNGVNCTEEQHAQNRRTEFQVVNY